MRAMTIFDWIIRIVGSIALVLGLLIWTLHLNIINIHMLFGLLVALAMLIISLLAVFTKELRLLGIIGVVYAFILPLFLRSLWSRPSCELHANNAILFILYFASRLIWLMCIYMHIYRCWPV